MNRLNEDILIRVHGAVVNFKCDNPELISYTENRFREFLIDSAEDVDLVIELSWRREGWKALPAAKLGHNDSAFRIGRHLLAGENLLIWEDVFKFPELKIMCQLRGQQVYLKAFYDYKVSKRPLRKTKRLMKAFLFRRKLTFQKEELFKKLIDFIMSFPLFWYLSRFRRIHIFHCSAAEYQGRGIMFAGLGGAGKSTLTVALSSYPEGRFLSDNLMFYDSQKIYCGLESVKLDSKALGLLSKTGPALLQDDCNFVYGRKGYRVVASKKAKEAAPEALFIMRFAPKSYIKPMDIKDALIRLQIFQELATELSYYRHFASALDLIDPQRKSQSDATGDLNRLLEKISCFELGLQPNENLDLVIKDDILKNVKTKQVL